MPLACMERYTFVCGSQKLSASTKSNVENRLKTRNLASRYGKPAMMVVTQNFGFANSRKSAVKGSLMLNMPKVETSR